MTERYLSLAPIPASAGEQKLVNQLTLGGHVSDCLDLLFPEDPMWIDGSEIDKSRPDRESGLVVRGTLIDWRGHTDAKNPMVFGSMILNEHISKCVVPNNMKESEVPVVYSGDNRALVRVDATYKLTEADKAALKSRGVAITAQRSNGVVSVGVTPLYTGMVFNFSVYGIDALKHDGAKVTAGAVLQLHRVEFVVKHENGVTGDNLAVRVGKYTVVKCDKDNGERLSCVLHDASSTPLLDGTIIKATQCQSGWPKEMHLIRNEVPATPVQTGSQLAIDNGPGSCPLAVPDKPIIYTGRNISFIAHVGDSRDQAAMRMHCLSENSVFTRIHRPIPSGQEDAFKYTLTQNGVSVSRTRAQFALIATQIQADKSVSNAIIHCTIPAGAQIEILTAIPDMFYAAQLAVLPALVACMTGPIMIEPKIATETLVEIKGFENAVHYSAYISSLNPRIAQLTIPFAGFQVSHAWMCIERAINSISNMRDKHAGQPIEYYAIDGSPSLTSRVLQLNYTKLGFYDDASNDKLVRDFDSLKVAGEDKQRTAVSPLISTLKGPIVDLGATHYFFVIGRFVPTPHVIAHQRQLFASDPAALFKGNEQLALTGMIPDDFPHDVYDAMIEHHSSPSKKLQHYAISKEIVDGSRATNDMKRQLNAIVSAPKRLTIENSSTHTEELD